ncbi:MAG: hypothetical protein R2864_11965 [Syntrophotaleaceae bacterium]
MLRNYEGVITAYQEPDSYEPGFCDRRCDHCELQLHLEDAEEYRSTGIEKLLADHDQTISLTLKTTTGWDAEMKPDVVIEQFEAIP